MSDIKPYASNQEVFDIAARHLLTQMAKAEVMQPEISPEASRCLYRAPDGCKCAIGALIPDDLYQPEMDEGATSIDSVLDRFPTIQTLFVDVNPFLLSDLQDIHDANVPSYWARSLRLTAHEYGLSTDVLDELAELQS